MARLLFRIKAFWKKINFLRIMSPNKSFLSLQKISFQFDVARIYSSPKTKILHDHPRPSADHETLHNSLVCCFLLEILKILRHGLRNHITFHFNICSVPFFDMTWLVRSVLEANLEPCRRSMMELKLQQVLFYRVLNRPLSPQVF